MRMDALDREILAQLQSDGRLSVTELAERVGLTVSPCQRRLRALERDGVIAGYHAEVAPAALGFGFESLVFVTLLESAAPLIAAFEAAVRDLASVVQAQRLFGTPDYLLRVVARDLADFQRLYDSDLTVLPGVQKLTSTLVMKNVVVERGLPI